MSSKPTPGPWNAKVDDLVPDRGAIYVEGPLGWDKQSICDCRFSDDVETDEANAALIAEAGTVFHETGLTPQELRAIAKAYENLAIANGKRAREEHDRAETAEKQRDELLTALKAIVAIEAVPFDFPADWDAQIAGCSECQRYKDHPIQKGICDNHRKPLYARKRHEDDQQATLIYRAKDAARAAIASVEAAS